MNTSKTRFVVAVIAAVNLILMGTSSQAQTKLRVMVLGFQVNQLTLDDVLQRDGKGDEVFLSVQTRFQNKGVPDVIADKTSATFGDDGDPAAFSGRIQAGSCSAKGGLKTGDAYPNSNAWELVDSAANEIDLPMVVFDGTLAKDSEVSVALRVMEWDVDDKLLHDFAGAVGKFLKEGGAGEEAKVAVGKIDLGWIGQAATRPVGLVQEGQDNWVFKQPIIHITSENLPLLIETDLGFGKGVLPIAFEDAKELGSGKYTIFVRITTDGKK